MTGETIGLGVLSWRGAASLAQSLQSYQKQDFTALFDDSLLFLPDPDEAVRSVARTFPGRVETTKDNKGILAGMAEIAQRLETDYIFFTENDCPLLETAEEAARQISKAMTLINDNSACMARMRHVRIPGEAFETLGKFKRYHPVPDTLKAKAFRAMRPGKATRVFGTSIYADERPDLRFPRHISAAGDGFYLVSTAVMPWTNQSIIVKRSFFLDTILPYAQSVPYTRGANGFKALEVELNRSKFWTRSGWKIACGPGLLTHKRAEGRGY